MMCEVDFITSGEDQMDASSADLGMAERILQEPVFVKLLGFSTPKHRAHPRPNAAEQGGKCHRLKAWLNFFSQWGWQC